MIQLYACPDRTEGVMKEMRDARQAFHFNTKGYGIFWAVNEFKGARQKQNLVKVRYWAVDIDDGTKQEQWNRIKKVLKPSMIIETKNGFHVYYKAVDGTAENWKDIVEFRLIPYFKADKRAKDITRVLRVPGYKHLKDPKEPFKIKIIHQSDREYTSAEMQMCFPKVEPPKSKGDFNEKLE